MIVKNKVLLGLTALAILAPTSHAASIVTAGGIGKGSEGTTTHNNKLYDLDAGAYFSGHIGMYPTPKEQGFSGLGGYLSGGFTPNVTTSGSRYSKPVYGWTTISAGVGYNFPVGGFSVKPFAGIGYSGARGQFYDNHTDQQYNADTTDHYLNMNFGTHLGLSKGFGLYLNYDTAPKAAAIGISHSL